MAVAFSEVGKFLDLFTISLLRYVTLVYTSVTYRQSAEFTANVSCDEWQINNKVLKLHS
jgi:hypothetical protein